MLRNEVVRNSGTGEQQQRRADNTDSGNQDGCVGKTAEHRGCHQKAKGTALAKRREDERQTRQRNRIGLRGMDREPPAQQKRSMQDAVWRKSLLVTAL